MGFGCLMVVNICFTNLWELWELSEFDLYSYLGNSHVFVAMFDPLFTILVFWLYFYKQILCEMVDFRRDSRRIRGVTFLVTRV